MTRTTEETRYVIEREGKFARYTGRLCDGWVPLEDATMRTSLDTAKIDAACDKGKVCRVQVITTYTIVEGE